MSEALANLDLILETITDGILVVDKLGFVLYTNKSAEHIFAQPSLLGSKLAVPICSGDAPLEINIIRPDGFGWADLRCVPIDWKNQQA